MSDGGYLSAHIYLPDAPGRFPAATAIDAWQCGFPTTVVSDLTIAHAWGGHTVEENQKWSLDYIAAMAKSKIVRSDELMR